MFTRLVADAFFSIAPLVRIVSAPRTQKVNEPQPPAYADPASCIPAPTVRPSSSEKSF